MDATDGLYEELTNRFQQIIGVLRRSIELWRIGIMREVSFFYQQLCSPREGHLNAVYKVFRHLHMHLTKNSVRIEFDPACLHTDNHVLEGSKRELED